MIIKKGASHPAQNSQRNNPYCLTLAPNFKKFSSFYAPNFRKAVSLHLFRVC